MASMRIGALVASLFVSLMLAAGFAAAADNANPVVVELFTSQGCSSCPPADAYLGELAKRPDVLALGFHVDYWDYIGWQDPFALHLATERQRTYSHRFDLSYVYTPQMIVNGAAQGVGADRAEVDGIIKRLAAAPAAHPTLALERGGDGGLVIHVGAGQTPKPATIWLACYDRQHTTAILRGENSGRTLNYYQVVRRFETVGTWNGAALDLPVAASLVEGYGSGSDRGIAVLVQADRVGPILAAGVLGP